MVEKWRRALVELAPETLSIPNGSGRTPFEVAQRGFKPNPELLIYLEQASEEARAGNAGASSTVEAGAEGPREVVLMVMANVTTQATLPVACDLL